MISNVKAKKTIAAKNSILKADTQVTDDIVRNTISRITVQIYYNERIRPPNNELIRKIEYLRGQANGIVYNGGITLTVVEYVDEVKRNM